MTIAEIIERDKACVECYSESDTQAHLHKYIAALERAIITVGAIAKNGSDRDSGQCRYALSDICQLLTEES